MEDWYDTQMLKFSMGKKRKSKIILAPPSNRVKVLPTSGSQNTVIPFVAAGMGLLPMGVFAGTILKKQAKPLRDEADDGDSRIGMGSPLKYSLKELSLSIKTNTYKQKVLSSLS